MGLEIATKIQRWERVILMAGGRTEAGRKYGDRRVQN